MAMEATISSTAHPGLHKRDRSRHDRQRARMVRLHGLRNFFAVTIAGRCQRVLDHDAGAEQGR